MQTTIHDLKLFYRSKTGHVVRRVLKKRIAEIWQDTKGYSIMGLGYAVPYLSPYLKTASRLYALMDAQSGVHHWPNNKDGLNLTAVTSVTDLPIQSDSLDRIMIAHHLEYIDQLKINLQECHRVLKSGGKMLVIVPNRHSLWSRSDWSPFGHGTPFSTAQISYYLKDSGFVIDRIEEALFMPPVQSPLLLRFANAFETLGRTIWPFAAGVHILEVSKQIYARPPVGTVAQKTRSTPLFAKPAS